LCIVCCILHVVRCALCVASCTLHVVRCILHAVCFACCLLACCMLHVLLGML
jgi:hypothetical protein